MKARVIIAGGRDFNDYELLKRKMLENFDFDEDEVTIISGRARGADTLGEDFAEEYNLNLIRCEADWRNLGRKAGIIRNTEMAKKATEDVENIKPFLFAFWNGESRGTLNMIETAEKYGIETNIIRY